ncbi:radical SAM family heme chaperone HemW [Sphingobacterium sp. SYP-B4668]|uniref:radical SAM family heme chaperone HemW n=1 Tax=Sphingobacterium sp. SYP-B4668 TaxID=2996035 RepID=UPI0022DDA9B5|nr:radical SAM family heme chaperone HemW [Sphingobacterium sp. SYP-B4668]
MPSIYFHIPFCKKACHYCDFHFSTSLKYKSEMLEALQQELSFRKRDWGTTQISSIYFGGGTPSILEADDIQRLIDHVGQHYEIATNAEITLEANPDDLDIKKIKGLRNTSVNRFSIGIQSFFEEDLQWMNRAHNAAEADASIKRVQDAGFENITADLIYGYPLLTDTKWKQNIDQLCSYDIPHISAYSMTVEPQTALDHFIKNGKSPAMNETQSANQFEILIEKLNGVGFDHYEISNFAKAGHYAVHNSSYWKGDSYMGIGPSAHSFFGDTRCWNIANNAQYIKGIFDKTPLLETEYLSLENKVNEYIMTSLRTIWGMDIDKIKTDFGTEVFTKIVENIAPFVSSGEVELKKQHYYLTSKGKLIADHIASELFFVEE